MKKMIAFLYARNKKSKRVSDIAHIQTFTDLFLFFMFPFFLLSELLNLDIIHNIRVFSKNEKWLEYIVGVFLIVIPSYILFRVFFPEKKLHEYYINSHYTKNYLFLIRIIFIPLSIVSLFLTLKLKGKIKKTFYASTKRK